MRVTCWIAIAFFAVANVAGAQTTAWGDPDLQGIWSNQTPVPLERPAALAIRLIEPGAGHRRLELARKAGDGGDTVVALFGGLRLVEHEFSGRETWIHFRMIAVSC